jgi:predicted nucleic acid-binding Zn ribbon protein
VIPPRELRPLSDGLTAVLGALKGGDVRTVKGIFGTWDEAVGGVIAAHARPLRIDRGVLTVEVDEPGWATQLRFLEGEIRARLEAVGGTVVDRIEVRVAGVRQRPSKRH